MKFAELPPTDRWRALDQELPKMIEAHTKAAGIDPSDELSVDALAEKHGTTARALVKRLRDLGARPYKLGKVWHVRRKCYVLALEMAEQGEPVTTD